MAVLLDFERVLDSVDLYAFKNWSLGELIEGPVINRYMVSCTFLWPEELMPDPKGGRRLLPYDCTVKFKKSKMKVPKKIRSYDDFVAGTKYPALVEKNIWLVEITIPKELISDIREGSVDLENEDIDLEDLDMAYEQDVDQSFTQEEEEPQEMEQSEMGQEGEGQPPSPLA